MPSVDRASSDALNQSCYCIGTDADAMHARLAALQPDAVPTDKAPRSLFSELPVFVTRDEVNAMQAVVGAVTRTVGSDAWQAFILHDATPLDRSRTSSPVFMGFDFHLSAAGPQLIEINTNAGGGLLCAEGARFQFRQSGYDTQGLRTAYSGEAARSRFLDHFIGQFERRFNRRPQRVAIVDQDPANQPLLAEFLLFRELFSEAGLKADIVDVATLVWNGSALLADGKPVDLVYNRSTDFRFQTAGHEALAAATLSGAILVTPDPHAHALFANKQNLAYLTDAGTLAALGIPAADREILLQGIPRTFMVDGNHADHWWHVRDQYFFKPVSGFGGRGTYRGSKLTRRVFRQIMNGGYVAQAFVPPAVRSTLAGSAAAGTPLKFDIRCYVFEGATDFIAARLYAGQTTNFRTPGGGFAPVFIVSGSRDDDASKACAGPDRAS